jgi:RimJ/RimL family protein N-acetyltransferase
MKEVMLVVTNPKAHDLQEFYEMTKDSTFQKQFFNLKEMTLYDAKNMLEFIVRNESGNGYMDYAFIKLAWSASETDNYDNTNSKLIGFISLNQANQHDFLITGFKNLFSFGIIEEYRGKGIMIRALNMRIKAYIQNKMNFIAAFVKPNNIVSDKILLKCGFIKIEQSSHGQLYTRRLDMDESEYNKDFISIDDNVEIKQSMNYFLSHIEQKHVAIVEFFLQNGFGTSMPILSFFSYLKPIDRCIILEKLFDLKIRGINLYDKMVLAYVKVGRPLFGKEVIDFARSKGESEMNCWGLEQKLDLGIPQEITDQYRLEMLQGFLGNVTIPQEGKFLGLLINFIRTN